MSANDPLPLSTQLAIWATDAHMEGMVTVPPARLLQMASEARDLEAMAAKLRDIEAHQPPPAGHEEATDSVPLSAQTVILLQRANELEAEGRRLDAERKAREALQAEREAAYEAERYGKPQKG